MNDREVGAIHALLKTIEDAVRNIHSILDANDAKRLESRQALVPPGQCRHEHTKELPAMGGADPVKLCLDCEENVA